MNASPMSTLVPLIVEQLMDDTLGRLLIAVLVLAVVVLVGRLVLHVAWKLLVVAAVVIGVLYVGSIAIDGIGMLAI